MVQPFPARPVPTSDARAPAGRATGSGHPVAVPEPLWRTKTSPSHPGNQSRGSGGDDTEWLPRVHRKHPPPEITSDGPNQAPIGVFVYDDNPLYRLGLRALVDQLYDMTLVGEALDLEDAWARAFSCRPDVAVIGQRSTTAGHLDFLRSVVDDGIGVVVLTDTLRETPPDESWMFGTRRWLPRHVDPQGLADGIRAIASCRTDVVGADFGGPRAGRSGDTGARLPVQRAASPTSPMQELTSRQREVARLVADGLSNAEVAARLFVSQATVKSHLSIILKRLQLRDRTQLAITVNRNNVSDQLSVGWT